MPIKRRAALARNEHSARNGSGVSRAPRDSRTARAEPGWAETLTAVGQTPRREGSDQPIGEAGVKHLRAADWTVRDLDGQL
jgi:hypothetical protein